MNKIAVKFVFFVGLVLNSQVLVQPKKEVDPNENLITILSVGEIKQLFFCLRKSSDGVSSQPYLTTDVWFELLGYYVEPHKVTTADGYILTIFRVLRYNPLPQNKRPVIFMNHGISGSSNQWVVQEGRNNLAQALLNEGFEVWIGNCRGNSYSNRHVKLNPFDSPYWDFSWHEMGIYDVPAVLDKIIKHTEVSQVYYIGYSMGSTQYLVMLSEKPENNAKIRKGFLLAPAGLIYGATSPLRYKSFAELGKRRGYLNNFLLGGHIGSHKNVVKYFQGTIDNFAGSCAATGLFNCGLCANAMFYLAGFNPREMNFTAIPSFYKNYADTVGTKCLVHYAQLMNDPKSSDFKMFDYGEAQNIQRYGSSKPPKYNVSKIRAPTYLYYGRGDNIATPDNVEELAADFAPGVIKEMNLIDKNDPTNMFNHVDFITSVHAYQHFIRPILDVISRDYNITKGRKKV